MFKELLSCRHHAGFQRAQQDLGGMPFIDVTGQKQRLPDRVRATCGQGGGLYLRKGRNSMSTRATLKGTLKLIGVGQGFGGAADYQ